MNLSRSDGGSLFHTKGLVVENVRSCLHCGGSPGSSRSKTSF